jgi:hypothetical protein
MEGSPTNNSDALSTVSGSEDEEHDEFDVTGDDAPVLASRSDARTEVGSVQVSVRVRPFNANELAAEAESDTSAVSCIQFDEATPNSLTVKASKKGHESHAFAFDYVFDPHTPQDRVRGFPVRRFLLNFMLLTGLYRDQRAETGVRQRGRTITGQGVRGLQCHHFRVRADRYVCMFCFVVVYTLFLNLVVHPGSGKTFTMSGNKSAEGIIPRMNRCGPCD